jgi:2Fe-2S ferredoxin
VPRPNSIGLETPALEIPAGKDYITDFAADARELTDRMPKMVFIERDGNRKEVEAPVGLSVLEIAHRNEVDIEGACEGSLACSTCHVIVDPDWHERLPEASEDEEDMLDLAFDLQRTSRLGCQLIITKEMDGLTVRLPGDTRNMLLE